MKFATGIIVQFLALALLIPTAEASVLGSRNLRSSNTEEVKEIDEARELHGHRTNEVREDHYGRTAPEHQRPRSEEVYRAKGAPRTKEVREAHHKRTAPKIHHDPRTNEVREDHYGRTAPEHHRPKSEEVYPAKGDPRTKEVREAHHKGTAPKIHHRPRSEDNPAKNASFRNFVPFTADKLKVATKAATYSREIYKTLDGITIHEAHDGVDAMAMHADENFCWVIFRGTDEIDDWAKNLNIDSYTLEDSGGCKVHEGFYRNYAGMGKFGDNEKVFEPMITNFLESEECSSKQVIFTGHSLGGASALVGAIIWSSTDPITITFGQPSVFTPEGKGPCQINEDNIWRFINSENPRFFGSTTYDLVPAISPFQHIGGFIVLPPGDTDGNFNPDTKSVVQFNKNHPEIYYPATQFDVSAHRMLYAEPKMRKLAEQTNSFGNLDVSGFIDGTKCYIDKECASFNEVTGTGGCIDTTCTDGSLGSNCENLHQCQSGRCEFDSMRGTRSCYAKLEKGEFGCNEDNDCISNSCIKWKMRCN